MNFLVCLHCSAVNQLCWHCGRRPVGRKARGYELPKQFFSDQGVKTVQEKFPEHKQGELFVPLCITFFPFMMTRLFLVFRCCFLLKGVLGATTSSRSSVPGLRSAQPRDPGFPYKLRDTTSIFLFAGSTSSEVDPVSQRTLT